MGTSPSKSEEFEAETQKLRECVQKELAKAFEAITLELDNVLKSKEQKNEDLVMQIQQLENERDSNYQALWQNYEDKLQQLKKQHDSEKQELQTQFNHAKKQHDSEKQEMQTQLNHAKKQHDSEKQEFQTQLNQAKKQYKQAQEDLHRLKIILTDPTREMRMRDECIRPGDIIHDSVAKEFKEIYNDRQFLQKLKITTPLERAQFLTKLFECAYACCSREIKEIAIKELDELHKPPKRTYTVEEKNNSDIWFPWKGRQDAYSRLISVAEAKQMPLPEHVISQVMKVATIDNVTNNQEADVKEVVKRITEISWKMVLLTPPITFSFLPIYDEEMHEKSLTKEVTKELISEGKFAYEHTRPVLFYGPLGTVGKKGEVRIVPLPLNDESLAHKHTEQNSDDLQTSTYVSTPNKHVSEEGNTNESEWKIDSLQTSIDGNSDDHSDAQTQGSENVMTKSCLPRGQNVKPPSKNVLLESQKGINQKLMAVETESSQNQILSSDKCTFTCLKFGISNRHASRCSFEVQI